MRKLAVLLLAVMFLSGCSIQAESSKEASVGETLESSQANSSNVSQDTSSTTGSTDSSNSVYGREYYEQEAITAPRTMFLEGSASLKAFPYGEADSINEIRDKYVIVHTVVQNEEREEWALVEFTDVVNINNFGYIKLDRLSEKVYEPAYVCATEAISGIAIGDSAEKAILQFGHDYEIYKTELGWSYAFPKEKGSVVAGIDPISNTVTRVYVTSKGYKTKEGFQVGDNAIKVLAAYKAKYEMNTGQHLFSGRPESIFNLGNGYVIEFGNEPNVLGETSIITSINYYNIHDGDW